MLDGINLSNQKEVVEKQEKQTEEVNKLNIILSRLPLETTTAQVETCLKEAGLKFKEVLTMEFNAARDILGLNEERRDYRNDEE